MSKIITEVTSEIDVSITEGMVLKVYIGKLMGVFPASLIRDADGVVMVEEYKITHIDAANKIARIAETDDLIAYISIDGIVYVTDYVGDIQYEGSIVDYLIYDFSADGYEFTKLQSMVVRHKEIREYAEIKYRESISG